jgi:acyl-CoA thioester hydrolase
MTTPKPVHQLTLRVYYEDTDFSGRVYHASYLRFMERGRTEWLRHRGFEHGTLAGEQGLVFAVRKLEIEYLAPAVIDDLLSVETRIADLRGAAIEFAQNVSRGADTLAAAKVRVVALRNGRAVRIPSALRAGLDAQL